MNFKSGIIAAALMSAAAMQTFAAVIDWVDWSSATTGLAGTAACTLSGGVNVSYTGEVNFAQTAGGANYWSPNGSYLSGTVGNSPTTTDIIGINGGYGLTQTITFSQAVVNPLMAIVSLGQPGVGVRLNYDAPATILSYGGGYWGGGSITQNGTNGILGYEGHGVVQFMGTYNSISFTAPDPEYWYGFTFGIEGVASTEAVPEPSSLILGMLGFAMLVGFGMRRARKTA
jgi:PEP-CTERM motif